jgi:uncharacterized SAM-binding protein YcdF (DUF218 family)
VNLPAQVRSPGPLLRHVLSRGFSLGLGALARPFLPWLTRSHRFRTLPQRLMRVATPAPVDLIHVLGGGLRHPTLRVDHGVALFRRGLAPRLLLTGAGFQLDWAQRNRNRALELGVPESALALDASPTTTRAEARVLREMARREGLRSVMVVTEAFHAGRAARIFERALRPEGVRVLSCPADLGVFPPVEWWGDRQARATVLGEAARLLLARGTGGA